MAEIAVRTRPNHVRPARFISLRARILLTLLPAVGVASAVGALAITLVVWGWPLSRIDSWAGAALAVFAILCLLMGAAALAAGYLAVTPAARRLKELLRVAEAVAEGLGDVAGRRVLLARADIARADLAEILRARGASVDEVVAYRTLPAEPEPGALSAALSGRIDVATFTSASTVRTVAALLGGRSPASALGGALVACIGPITVRAAEEVGLRADVVASSYTLAGLVEAIEKAVAARRSDG